MKSWKRKLMRFIFSFPILSILILAGAFPVAAAKYGFHVPYKTLYVGESERVSTYGYTGRIYYYTGNKNCFTVDDAGLIRAVGPSVSSGITLRIYTAGNKQSLSTKLVIKKPYITGYTKLEQNRTTVLTFHSNMMSAVQWRSSRPDIVSIQSCSTPRQQKCTIRALKSGTSTLSAVYLGHTYTFQVTVPEKKVTPTPTPKPTPKPTPRPQPPKREVFSVSPTRVTCKKVARVLLTVTQNGQFNVSTSPAGSAEARIGDRVSKTVYPVYITGSRNGVTTAVFRHGVSGSTCSAEVTFTGVNMSAQDCRDDIKRQITSGRTPRILNQKYGGYTCSSRIAYQTAKNRFVFVSDVKNGTISGKLTLQMNSKFTKGTLTFKGKYLKNGKPFTAKASLVPGNYERGDTLRFSVTKRAPGLSKNKTVNLSNSAKDAAFFMWNMILANDYGFDLSSIGFSQYSAVYK